LLCARPALLVPWLVPGPLRRVRGCRPPVVSGGGVVVDAGLGGGVDVDGGVIEAGDAVDQLVMGLVGDRVGLNDAERVIDGQGDLGAHPVPDPAQPDTVDAADFGDVAQAASAAPTRSGSTASISRR